MQEVFSSLRADQLKATISTKLLVYLNAFTSGLYLAGLGVIMGLFLKYIHLTGEHMVFIFSMVMLAFFLFLQIGLSLVFIYRHLKLALLGAFTSLSTGMACLALVFLFEQWWGSYILVFLTIPLFILNGILLAAFFITGNHKHTTHRKFLYFNIVIPYIFVLAMAGLYALMF